VRDFDLARYVENGQIMARRTPRPVQFALASSVLALHDAEIDLDACDPDRFGVHVGTSIGNMATVLGLNDEYARLGKLPAHTAFYAFNHSAACVVSSFFNIRGPVHTTTSGCNSGVDALGQSMRMIQSGAVDAMLVVGTDCEVVPEVVAALNASGSLATKFNDDPGRSSRPFDRRRDGNVIGEGAAALLLESEAHARRRKARVYARLTGYQVCGAGQNRQYSHDNPEPDLRPCVRALRGALAEAGVEPRALHVLNANGSSSVIYDRLEAMAFAEVFGEALPRVRVHSQKSMLGQHGEPDPTCAPLVVQTTPHQGDLEHVLVHSIGLGGFYYSAAVFEAADEVPMQTGLQQVVWSDVRHPRFKPAAEFGKPLRPWAPRADGPA
jgi:3-oxoacyl-[acyl-carrier-protein] synthase II